MPSAETSEHFERMEDAIKAAKVLLSRHPYPCDLRTTLVAGLIAQMVEHHAAVLLLIRSGMVGSAFALARSIFEGMYRGLWINFCATEDEIEKFEKEDCLRLKMREMAQAIDEKYHVDDFYADLVNRGWKALNSYAHSGLLQLGRRFKDSRLEPSYSDEEIVEVTATATTCVLLLVSRFLAAQNHSDEAGMTHEIIEAYGLARITRNEIAPHQSGRLYSRILGSGSGWDAAKLQSESRQAT